MADSFCWYELMTSDAEAAADFYRHVVGWTAEPMADSPMPYTVLQVDGAGVGGIFPLSPEMIAAGVSPGWMGYIAVADVDASQTQAVTLGGVAHKPAEDIPGIGRFAMMADPGGAVFTLFKANDGTPPPTGTSPGHIGWRELMARSLDEEWAFYSALFGWTKGAVHDMGPMGDYLLFKTGGDQDVGGMMTKPATLPASFWAYYVFVDGIRAAADRIAAKGGQVVNGPMQVPGGDWILQAMDPQGAFFCLTSRTE